MSGKLIEIGDEQTLLEFLCQDAALHVYELGDLDPFFWPHTRWFGWRDHGLQAVCLLYAGAMPTLLAHPGPGQAESMARLLAALDPMLPDRVHAHLSLGLLDGLAAGWHPRSSARMLKMQLTDPARLEGIDTARVVPVTPADLDAIRDFYRDSYPANWFDPRMLETGHYRGIREGADWCAVAGVHVYSPRYGVAALGNIVTAPAHRGRGLGRAVTAAVCRALLQTTAVIGLNVHVDNAAARACYDRLGFAPVVELDEVLLERRA